MPNKWTIRKFLSLCLHLRWHPNPSAAHLLPWSSLIHPHSWEKLKPSPCVWNQGKSVQSAKSSGITRLLTGVSLSIVGHTAGIQACFSLGSPKHSAHRMPPLVVCIEGGSPPRNSPLVAQCHPKKLPGMQDTRAGEAWHKPWCVPKGVCSRTWPTLTSVLISFFHAVTFLNK